MGGGNVSISSQDVARATYIVSGGTITSATVTDSGTGYTGNFSVTIPSELGGGVGAILNATKGTINRSFGNIEIDIRKGNLTLQVLVYMVTTVYSDLEKTLQTKQLVTSQKVDLLLTITVVFLLIKALAQNLTLTN